MAFLFILLHNQFQKMTVYKMNSREMLHLECLLSRFSLHRLEPLPSIQSMLPCTLLVIAGRLYPVRSVRVQSVVQARALRNVRRPGSHVDSKPVPLGVSALVLAVVLVPDSAEASEL